VTHLRKLVLEELQRRNYSQKTTEEGCSTTVPQVDNPAEPARQTLENRPTSPSQTGGIPAPGLIQKQKLFRYPQPA
jgi:hypothetical protein